MMHDEDKEDTLNIRRSDVQQLRDMMTAQLGLLSRVEAEQRAQADRFLKIELNFAHVSGELKSLDREIARHARQLDLQSQVERERERELGGIQGALKPALWGTGGGLIGQILMRFLAK